MMGERRVMQEALFYGFSLDRHVPDSHLLRKIDRFVDLSGLRAHLGPYYSDVGRPSIDPELMIRMLIVGYCFGIRSERRLCDEVHLNLAYRWFCRLGLDADVPDHSTFSKNRHGRFRESDLLRKLFETVVARCMKEGIVGGERTRTQDRALGPRSCSRQGARNCKTEAYAVSRRERKKVEMLFAHLKRILRLDRLRLRGPSGAKDEFLLAATAQNLRKLAKLIPLPAPVFVT
jgi:transposase